MKIVIGCDHAATELKAIVKKHISDLGYEVCDVGTHTNESCHYPVFAHAACEKILDGECELGILICGTGIGMSICANKVKGIRCALCSDTFSAKATREHNDANVLAFGERVIGAGLAQEIVDVFLKTEFSGAERHVGRIAKVTAIESKYFK